MPSEGVFLFGTLISLSTLKCLLSEMVRRGKPRSARQAGQVTGMVVFPVKSCRGVQVQEAGVTRCGLVDTKSGVADRHFMIVDEADNFISQRKEPSLALVSPSIHGDMLHVDAPGLQTLVVPLRPPITPSTHISSCRVWGDAVAGADCGTEAAQWFSSYLGRAARLVYAGPGLTRRELFRDYSHLCRPYDKVAFQDWGQSLLISEASLNDLNSRLERPVTMNNFRPNIIVSGKEPYEEDNWQKMYMGEVQFTNIKLCGRCNMITVDPNSGVKAPDQQPLKTIKTYRKKPGHSDPCFGINVFCDIEGTIRIGDQVDITTKDS